MAYILAVYIMWGFNEPTAVVEWISFWVGLLLSALAADVKY